MSERTVYLAFRAAGLDHIGACAMLGNLTAESSLKADIVQRGTTSLSDAEFTRRVDSGELDFISGFSGGYGLAQWTYPSRKQKLLDFARSRGVSVGDEAMQTDFCIQELRSDFPDLFRSLCTADNLYTAVSRVCREYERPAVNNIEARHRFAVEAGRRMEALDAKDAGRGVKEAVACLEQALRILKGE